MGKVYLALEGREAGVLTVKGPLALLKELLATLVVQNVPEQQEPQGEGEQVRQEATPCA